MSDFLLPRLPQEPVGTPQRVRKVNRAALQVLPILAKRWLPDGKLVDRNWVAKNPHSVNSRTTYIKVELVTGRWHDYDLRLHDRGAVSLAVYLSGETREEIVNQLRRMLEL